jgi:predicted transcriptional regulator
MVGTGVIRRNDATSTYTQFNTTAQWRVVISGNENFRVNASETYSRVVIRSASDIVAFYSDERLKTKKGSIDNALQKILQLDGFYYTTNDLAKSVGYTEEGLQVGISAQQVQNILPEVVTLAPFDSTYDDDGNLYSISGENYLTVKYEKMVPLIIEGIKDQQKIVNWNNTEVKKLKNVIESQQKQIDNQQRQIDELKEMIKSLIK